MGTPSEEQVALFEYIQQLKAVLAEHSLVEDIEDYDTLRIETIKLTAVLDRWLYMNDTVGVDLELN